MSQRLFTQEDIKRWVDSHKTLLCDFSDGPDLLQQCNEPATHYANVEGIIGMACSRHAAELVGGELNVQVKRLEV